MLCVRNADYEVSLDARKFYVALADREADARGQLRVVDESGEDYLFPASLFVDVPLSPAVRRRLLAAV